MIRTSPMLNWCSRMMICGQVRIIIGAELVDLVSPLHSFFPFYLKSTWTWSWIMVISPSKPYTHCHLWWYCWAFLLCRSRPYTISPLATIQLHTVHRYCSQYILQSKTSQTDRWNTLCLLQSSQNVVNGHGGTILLFGLPTPSTLYVWKILTWVDRSLYVQLYEC